ncbi:unnamed protein product [marine sediment metagenome]|uniref:Uncharacterized protein n=1 Tax=marine sediment metagenome TaxID=412755 RepID=X0Y5I2_9ZZZZ
MLITYCDSCGAKLTDNSDVGSNECFIEIRDLDAEKEGKVLKRFDFCNVCAGVMKKWMESMSGFAEHSYQLMAKVPKKKAGQDGKDACQQRGKHVH